MALQVDLKLTMICAKRGPGFVPTGYLASMQERVSRLSTVRDKLD